jgi:hypothetical protein
VTGSASQANSTLTSAWRLASSLGGAGLELRPNHSAGRKSGRLGVCAEGCGRVVCCAVGICAGGGVCADAETHTSAVAATLLHTALRMGSSCSRIGE